MMRFTVRLKSVAENSFRKSKTSHIGRTSEAGFGQALRSFGTSDGCWSRKPVARSVQKEIVYALYKGARKRASYLLSELGSESRQLQAADFVYILQYCARTPDPSFVMETWNLMKERDIELSDKCYFLTVRALCKYGYSTEAYNILRENSDIFPTLPIYNNLLEACIRMNNLDHASECLHLMEHQGVGKNAITYSLLLKLAVLQKDLSAVHKIWKDYINSYTLNIITLRKFIGSFVKLGDLESAYLTLQQMIAVAFQNKFSIKKTAEGRLFDSRIDIPIPTRDEFAGCKSTKNDFISLPYSSACYKENVADKLVKFGAETKEVRADDGLSYSGKHFSGPVMKLLRWSFNDMMHTCASSKNVMLAEQLMLQMQNLGLELSCGTYDGFVRTLVRVKGFREGVEVLNIMQQKNMKPHDSTLAAMSLSCSRALELDLAETFLDQISKCSHIHPFNAFLEACDTLDKPERAVRVLAKIKSSNILPDIRTYEWLFSLFGNVNSPYEDGDTLSQVDVANRISALEMDMTRHGIRHSHLSMQNLLRALGMEGMTKELIQYLGVAENQFLSRGTRVGTPIYNTVLHALLEANESHMAIQIFKSMISCGLSPDAATYNIMIDCCSLLGSYKSASSLVSMMIRDGFCAHAVTYTALIKILLNLEDFDEALELLDQASTEGIQPDLVLYNTILQVAGEKGRIDVVELIVEQMHQEKVQPDPSTCTHVFFAYIDNGFHSTAMEALQVLSMRMISEEENTLEEYRLEYENVVCDEGSEAESEIIELFKDSEYVPVALLYLRWCATFELPISWSPNQSVWAKRLSGDYASRRQRAG